MYVRVLQDELQFPDDQAMDQDTKSLIREVSHCFALILIYRILILVAVAPTAHPCAPHRRATNKTPPLLLYDVCAQIRYWICLTFCFCFFCRDWSDVYFKRYIRSYCFRVQGMGMIN